MLFDTIDDITARTTHAVTLFCEHFLAYFVGGKMSQVRIYISPLAFFLFPAPTELLVLETFLPERKIS